MTDYTGWEKFGPFDLLFSIESEGSNGVEKYVVLQPVPYTNSDDVFVYIGERAVHIGTLEYFPQLGSGEFVKAKSGKFLLTCLTGFGEEAELIEVNLSFDGDLAFYIECTEGKVSRVSIKIQEIVDEEEL